MPMERSLSPLRSAITPSRAKCGETSSFAGGMAISPLDRQTIGLAAKGDEGVGVFGEDSRLLRFPSGVDLDKQARPFPDPFDFARQRRGDLLPVDGLDHVESLHRLPRFVALQGPDQMKLDRLAEIARARPQIAPFGDRLLHPILTEAGLIGARDRRPDFIGRERLGYGDQLDRFRRTAAIARSQRNRLAQREKTRDGL